MVSAKYKNSIHAKNKPHLKKEKKINVEVFIGIIFKLENMM
jgi:hypothetical protein